jgi:hypothetical protein
MSIEEGVISDVPFCVPNCPFGLEDGHIVAYRAESSRLEVTFEFWNEHRGKFRLGGKKGTSLIIDDRPRRC